MSCRQTGKYVSPKNYNKVQAPEDQKMLDTVGLIRDSIYARQLSKHDV